MHNEDDRNRNGQGWRGRDMNDWDDRRYGAQGGYGNYGFGNQGSYGGMGTWGQQGTTGQGGFGGWGQGSWSGNQGDYGQHSQGSTSYGSRPFEEGSRPQYGQTYGQGQWNQGQPSSSRGYYDEGRGYPYGRGFDSGTGLGQGSYGTQGYGWSEPWQGSRQGFEERHRDWGGEGGRSYGQGSMGPGAWSEQRGMHAGKGPRGYRKSDQRLHDEVSDALTRDPGVDATEIDVKVENGEVTLTGTVQDRNQKRMAEHCAERVEGVQDVHNQVRVKNEARPITTADPNRESMETGQGSAGSTSAPRNQRS